MDIISAAQQPLPILRTPSCSQGRKKKKELVPNSYALTKPPVRHQERFVWAPLKRSTRMLGLISTRGKRRPAGSCGCCSAWRTCSPLAAQERDAALNSSPVSTDPLRRYSRGAVQVTQSTRTESGAFLGRSREGQKRAARRRQPPRCSGGRGGRGGGRAARGCWPRGCSGGTRPNFSRRLSGQAPAAHA